MCPLNPIELQGIVVRPSPLETSAGAFWGSPVPPPLSDPTVVALNAYFLSFFFFLFPPLSGQTRPPHRLCRLLVCSLIFFIPPSLPPTTHTHTHTAMQDAEKQGEARWALWQNVTERLQISLVSLPLIYSFDCSLHLSNCDIWPMKWGIKERDR